MGIPVLIMGASGAGKSYALRNFEPDEVGVMNVFSKPLPFRKALRVMNNCGYEDIKAVLRKNKSRCYVIDDSQYLMALEQIAKAKEAGFGKYTDIGLHFIDLIKTIINETSPDTIVYMLHHIDRDEAGRTKAKTVGKLIDNWVTLEGMFSIVLLAETDGKGHWFTTQSDGLTTAKSPAEMFPERMDNDIKAVDTAIRDFYGLSNK